MPTIIDPNLGITFPSGDTQTDVAVAVRQTCLSGPVDANGFAAFGGATGGTVVTTAGTVEVTAAFGKSNRVGAGTNLAWTGLSTNGTLYLNVVVNADRTLTPVVRTLATNYQWGGTYSVVSGQPTFNIQEMTMKVGNGTVANQAYEVSLGEVTVAAGVVSTIAWYQLMGRYDSPYSAVTFGTNTTYTHNLGGVSSLALAVDYWKCTVAEVGYSVGDVISFSRGGASGSYGVNIPIVSSTAMVMSIALGGIIITNRATFAAAVMTAANWQKKASLVRGW